jgi:hypothetical protein
LTGSGKTRLLTALCQGTTLQTAEKVSLAAVSYQGMTLVMPQSVQNRRRALEAAEEFRIVVELAFRPASKPFVFVIPSGL